MIKLIATDLDNTVLHNGHLVPGTAEAFTKAAERGIEIVVATGRSFVGITEEVRSVSGIRYAITCNGACINDVRTGGKIMEFTLSKDTVKTLVEIGHKFGATYEIFVDGKGYVSRAYYDNPVLYGIPERLVEYIHFARIPVDDIDGFIEENALSIANFAYVVKDETMHGKVNENVISLAKDVFVTSSDEWWIEVMDKESGKGKGLKHLCEHLGINLSDTAAFGDADNDIEMLEYAGTAYCMGNGSKNAKEVSDYVVDTCANGGVAQTIQEILNGPNK